MCLILAVAFSTLLERKILRLIQGRLGPNKTSIGGLIQPVLDGVKLLFKIQLKLEVRYKLLYKLTPLASLVIMMLFFLSLPLKERPGIEYQSLWLLVVLGVNSHVLLIRGWASRSKYRIMGSVRRLSQTVSFEIILTLVVFLAYFLDIVIRWDSYFSMPVIAIRGVWLVVFLLENQRRPFDLAEAERELVRGFNTEFTAIFFIYFFLAEYGNLLIRAALTHIIWLNWSGALLVWIILWFAFRACYPRIRFDKLMSMTWIILLPIVLFFWVFYLHIYSI